MSISEAVSSFLSGGGGKSASFPEIGSKIKGTIITAEERQQVDLDTEKPAFWDDGKPKMQLVITLQTDERDPEDPEDEGVRNLYVKGSKKPESKSMAAAVILALRAAKVRTIEVGGLLAVAYVGDGEPTRRGFNPPKQYEAAYKPPAIGSALLADEPAPAPAAPAAAAADTSFLDGF